MTRLITVTLTKKQMLSSDVVALTLTSADGSPLPKFDAGAHIDVHIDDDTIRQYSLCSDPSETAFYRLGILNDPQSRGGSRRIHEQLEVGETITISEPRNLFPLDMSATHSILVGGGIGITPMLAMAQTLKSMGKSFDLHYCTRSHTNVAFLEELQHKFGDSLHLHCDDLEDTQRLNPTINFTHIIADTHLYTCGPSGFMEWIINSAKDLGLSDTNIHYEYFSVDVNYSGTSFTVIAEQSGKAIEVSDQQTIVQALSDAGIHVDVSCEKGICGTCIVDVIEGVPEHRDHFLTEDEKEDNDQIAVCCSRSKSLTLVLDI